MIYTTNMLLEKNEAYSNAYNKIQRDCRSGKLIKLMRGLYEDNPNVAPYLCSAYILGPSYISFDYVLSKSGLIPEYVPNITCACFRKNKAKVYDTPIGVFIYRDIPQAVFPYGTMPYTENGYSYIMATPEKALCDKLYSILQVQSMDAFEKLLFEDLRIDRDLLLELDVQFIFEIAPKYRKKNLNYLRMYFEKELKR